MGHDPTVDLGKRAVDIAEAMTTAGQKAAPNATTADIVRALAIMMTAVVEKTTAERREVALDLFCSSVRQFVERTKQHGNRPRSH